MGFISKLLGIKERTEFNPGTITATAPARDQRADSDIPDLQGDYAKAVFLWAFSKASPIKNRSNYPGYILYECGIRDASKYHRSMIKNGYLAESSIEEKLRALKVDDLKIILSDNGQTSTGKKEVLIQRILETVATIELTKYCTMTTYAITEEGKAFLANHDAYVKIHKHTTWGVSWQEYDAKHKPGFSFYDTMWGILNERAVHDRQTFGRNDYFYMYQLLVEEGRRLNAVEMLLRVLYIDLSGVEGMSCYQLYKQNLYSLKELKECFNMAIMLAPGIVNPIAYYKDIYDDSIVDHLYEWKLPVQVCGKELFQSIIHSVLDGTYNYEVFESKLKAEYNKMLKGL